MAAAQNPDELLRSTTGKANFQRVTRLLISGGTCLLREVFDAHCPPVSLPATLNNHTTKKVLKTSKLTKPQMDCLYPSPGVCGKSTDFDITLLFKLLRTICNLKPPSKGWDALQAATDHSLTADLARIKYYRNSVYGHVGQSMEISDQEFTSIWQEISETLVRLAGHISSAKMSEWQTAIGTFLKSPLTAEDERYVQELERWYENDVEVKKSIANLKILFQEGIDHFDRRLSEVAEDIINHLDDKLQSMGLATPGGMSSPRDDVTESDERLQQPCISPMSKNTISCPVDEVDFDNQRTNLCTPSQRVPEIKETEELRIKGENDENLSICELPMKEELTLSRSMITRKSIGQPGIFQEKVFLVVGATGSGKSTLINAMVNYIMGVKWEDDFRWKVASDEDQTNSVTAYAFYPMDGSAIPYTFTVIDTPGFGATGGVKRDKEITEQIKKLFSIPPPEGIDHLDGIGFVTQASQARLTPTQEYIFNSILSIFSKDVSKNIFMMITFADGQQPPVLEALKKANIPSQKEQVYIFSNLTVFAGSKRRCKESFDEMFWKMGFSSFKTFFLEFSKSESVSLRLTKKVLKEREQLHVALEDLNEQITLGLDKLEEMRQEKIVLQQHQRDIETNKNFIYKVSVSKSLHVDVHGTGRHTTTCVPCHRTCHANCRIPDDRKKLNCWAIGEDGKCRICPSHCIWSEHKNIPFLITHQVVTETRTIEDLQRNYRKAVQGKDAAGRMMRCLEESRRNVHIQVLTMIKEAQKSLCRLDEIALKPSPLTAVDYIELRIESEKRTSKPGWKLRLKYYEVVKTHANLLWKLQDDEESQKLIRRLSSQGMGDTEEARDALEKIGKLSLHDDVSDED